MIRARLKRIVSMSEGIINALDSGDKTSAVLPRVRHLAQMAGDRETEAWANMEMYGIFDVPPSRLDKAEPSTLAAIKRFFALRRAPDYDQISLDDLLYRSSTSINQARKSGKVFHGPIAGLEAAGQPATLEPTGNRRLAEDMVKARLLEIAALAAAQRVRDYAYDWVGRTLESALRELENVELLGPDYPLAITSLDALESGVGQELAAALDSLRSTNPASWSGSVLICRSVVLKLGRQLWKIDGDHYESAVDGKTPEIGPEKEKNKLYAYIDYHHSSAVDQAAQQVLEEAHELVHPIYQVGSKGKRGTEVTYEEAQNCVVDTFRLVELLRQSTGLAPLVSGK
jgi:hypothetical protein